jgi:hypothetical protein
MWFDKTKKKELQLPKNTGLKDEKTLGFINPLWKITIEHKDKQLVSLPLCNMIHTYLKDYGFTPDEKINPSLCVILDTGIGKIKMPLFIKEMPPDGTTITPEYAQKKGLIYRK